MSAPRRRLKPIEPEVDCRRLRFVVVDPGEPPIIPERDGSPAPASGAGP
jgi:hypothetical protein